MPRYFQTARPRMRAPYAPARRYPAKKRNTTYKKSYQMKNWSTQYDKMLYGHTKSISHNPGQYQPGHTVKKIIRNTVAVPSNITTGSFPVDKEAFARFLPGVANVLKQANPAAPWGSPVSAEAWAALEPGYYWDRIRIDGVKVWMSAGLGNEIVFQWSGANERKFTSRGVTNSIRPALGLEVPIGLRRWLTKEDIFKPGVGFSFFNIDYTTLGSASVIVIDITISMFKEFIGSFVDAQTTPMARLTDGTLIKFLPEYQMPQKTKFGSYPLTYPYNDRVFMPPADQPRIEFDPFDPDNVNPADDPDNPAEFPPLPPIDDDLTKKFENQAPPKNVFQNHPDPSAMFNFPQIIPRFVPTSPTYNKAPHYSIQNPQSYNQ